MGAGVKLRPLPLTLDEEVGCEQPDKPGWGPPCDAMTEVSGSVAAASLAQETTALLFATLTRSGRLGSTLG